MPLARLLTLSFDCWTLPISTFEQWWIKLLAVVSADNEENHGLILAIYILWYIWKARNGAIFRE
jgi:hypothetical protein